MQREVSAVQFMPLSVPLQPPLSRPGLGYLCCFAVVNVSPHVTGKPKLLGGFFASSKGFFFLLDFFVKPGILHSWQVWPQLLGIAEDHVSEATAVATQCHC